MFTCATCGGVHDLSDIQFGADAPAQWLSLSDDVRAESLLSSDVCCFRLDGEPRFFIRGCLDIPIIGEDKSFTWGVWASLSERSFREVIDYWDDEKRVNYGPYFGWLCTAIPDYPDTMLLKTMVHQRAGTLRPFIELEPTDHPLAVQQREGITRRRLDEIVIKLLHHSN